MLEYSGQAVRVADGVEVQAIALRSRSALAVARRSAQALERGAAPSVPAPSLLAPALAQTRRSGHRRAVVALQPSKAAHGARPVHQPVLAAARQPRLRRDDRSRARAARGVGISRSRAGDGRAADDPARRLRSRSIRTAGKGWDHSVGTLAIVHAGQPDEVVLSRANERIALCINSFSTPAGGVDGAARRRRHAAIRTRTTRIGRQGRGRARRRRRRRSSGGARIGARRDRRHLDAHRRVRQSRIRRARRRRRATSGTSCSGAASRTTRRTRASGSRRRRTRRRRCGRRSRPRSATTVRVTIASTFSTKPARTLVAEIPGRIAPERAHRHRRARAGAGRERQRQRRRDARRAGARARARHRAGHDSAARTARSRFSGSTRSPAAASG